MPIELDIGRWLGALLVAPLLVCLPAAAEPVQLNGGSGPQLAQARGPQAQPKAAAAAQAAAGGDSGLKQRVEQLEEQLVDMQVTIGTLESLARGGSGAAPSTNARGDTAGGYGAAADVRIDGLETQVRALAAQMEQLTAQVRALLAAPHRADATPPIAPAAGAPQAGPPQSGPPQSGPPQAGPPKSGPSNSGMVAPSDGQPDASRFGSTTVTAGSGDAIRGLIDGDADAAGAAAPAAGTTLAATPPAFMPPPQDAATAANPKQLYETAYGYLMQRDYGAAQASFEQFLVRYPKDSLAGNAQYWLGEAHFVRGEYKDAAASFLKGYKDYAGNARAADSLLKLAMSLDRLGQTDAACTSFAELSTQFPNAPDNVKSHAKSERQRIGCH